MDTNVKTGLFPFEDVKETMSLDPEREALVREIWEGDEAVSYTHLTLPTTPYV